MTIATDGLLMVNVENLLDESILMSRIDAFKPYPLMPADQL